MTAFGRKVTLKINCLLLCLVYISNANACEYINGHWKSNKEKSMAYNYELDDIEPRSIEFLEQVLGNLELVVDENSLQFLEAPTIEIVIEGKTYPFEFSESVQTIKIIECSPNKIVIENMTEPGITNELILADRKTYWISPFGSWREYFDRIE